MDQQLGIKQSHDAMNVFQRGVKRCADILCAILGIVLCLPLFLFITLRLAFQKNGSVFFSQERIGRWGKPFQIYKFRTMSSEVEAEGPRLLPQGDEEYGTRFERWLRRRHLDELPQLWNVLKGDMSLVGPRPERLFFIKKIMEHTTRYELIYEMRPGLTSEATLYNGYTDTMEKMLKRLDMDIRYLENRSLSLDAQILWSTFIRLFRRKPF